MSARTGRTRTMALRLMTVVLALMIGLGVVEIALRAVRGQWFAAAPRFVRNGQLVTAAPSSSATSTASCFREDVRFNSKGFRGDEWGAKRRYRILMLGDSMLQGLQ